ncbi:hypothetical protein [Actinomadura sp. 9N407]|uniref:hypothetical protein n=1 Tax=Actinomadura sp. 9N407 TaxID=3375154 RepID=UPI0037B73310
MVFLGLLLAAAAVTAAAGIVLANDGAATLTVFGQDVPGVGNQWQVFMSGALIAVIFMIGMMLAFVGFGRLMRTRRDLRYLREEHEESMTTLEMEKRRLQRELARVRRDGDAPAPAPAPAPAAPRGAGVPQPRAAQPRGSRNGPTQDVPLAGSAARSTFFDRQD